MTPSRSTNSRRQRGSALLLIVIAAATLIGVVGLALDASHLGYMKARLQSTVDAMALAAAKRLDETGNTTAACEAARTTLNSNAQGFRELQAAMPPNITCPNATWFQIQFTGARVRVRIADVETPPSLARALIPFGFPGELGVSASAIAGPSAPLQVLCSLLPIAVCGDGPSPYFGFEPGKVYALKGKRNTNDGGVNGDYFLLKPEKSSGNENTDLRRNFAGGFGNCALIGTAPPYPRVLIKPGTNTGPVAQGINARFNDGGAAGQLPVAEFPPDVIIGEPSPKLSVGSTGEISQGSTVIVFGTQITGRNRADYLSRLAQGPSGYDIAPLPIGTGALLRREVAVPIAECSTAAELKTTVPIRGAGCFFLLQRMSSGGNNPELIAEFIENCEAAGRPGPNPGSGGPYVIQLFRDPASKDS